MKDLRSPQWALGRAGVVDGVWQAEVVGETADANPPNLRVLHNMVPIDGVTFETMDQAPDTWRMLAPIPPHTLSEGAQVFVVEDADTGRHLTSFSVVLGAAAEADLRGEVAMLRAELEMLKRAMRRQWREG